MSNSSLVDYALISPNKTVMETKVNKKITIHHMAGNLSVEQCGQVFAPTSRKASSNYGIDSTGRVGLYVEEKDRAWTSSSKDNDSQAVTIEVANCGGEPNWPVSDMAYNKLIDLCVDICKRNGIEKLVWTGDKNGNLTCHYMFAATACPGPYLKSKMQDIADAVNCRLNNTEVNSKSTKVKIDMSEEAIYKYFKNKGLTDEGVAGLLGNLYAESGLRSNNMQNSYEKQLGLNDDTYTAYMQYEIDENRLSSFYNDKVGYGLAQWTFWTRKKELAEYSVRVGHTIDSMQMQVAFLYNELETKYKGVLNELRTVQNIRLASDIVLTQFEKPANQSEGVKARRAEYGLTFYNKYAGKVISEPVKEEVPASQIVNKMVKVEIKTLNIRRGPGTNYEKVRYIPVGTYTIVEIKQGEGSKTGWGKLKSGVGWISLDYVVFN